MKKKFFSSVFFLFLFITTLSFLFSCKKKVQPTVKEERGSLVVLQKSLQGVAVPIDVVIDPARMQIGEDLLYVSCFTCDTMVYIFSLPDLVLLNSFGCKGNGPDDFIFPAFTNASKDTVGVWGYADFKKIKEFRVDRKGQLTFLREHLLKKNIVYNQLAKVNDTLALYNEFPSKLALKKVSFHSGECGAYSFEVDQDAGTSFFSRNKGVVQASGQHIAYLYTYKKKIDFFDLNFNLKHTYEDAGKKMEVDTHNYEACLIYYISSFAGKQNLYAINHNQGMAERSEHLSTLEIFTWDGQMTASVQLHPYVEFFVVDEKNQQLYGYNRDMPDSFYRYDLKNLSE